MDELRSVLENKERDSVEKVMSNLRHNYERYWSSFRAVTNCLLSDEIIQTFDVREYQEITEQMVMHFEYFNKWKSDKEKLG